MSLSAPTITAGDAVGAGNSSYGVRAINGATVTVDGGTIAAGYGAAGAAGGDAPAAPATAGNGGNGANGSFGSTRLRRLGFGRRDAAQRRQRRPWRQLQRLR